MNDSKILIVDDSKVDQLIISNILKDFNKSVANDGIEALEMIDREDDINMVILDLNMPRMNGFQVLENLKHTNKLQALSVIILTNYEEIENEIKGLELGAVDYIRKPLNSESLLKRIEVHYNLLMAKKRVDHHNQILEEEVKNRTKQLQITRDMTVNALVALLEIRDIESCNHTKRTRGMMKLLGETLGSKERYSTILTDKKVEIIYKTAPLHDIGKVGVPDNILLKPGKLTEEEYNYMKNHVMFGVDAMQAEFGHKNVDDFIHTALNIIGSHHEKFDGSGYPNGLSGEAIPLEGRMMAIVDVYDALTSKRVYKDAMTHRESLDIMISDSGSHFDPYLLEVFVEIQDEILKISRLYKSEKEVKYEENCN